MNARSWALQFNEAATANSGNFWEAEYQNFWGFYWGSSREISESSTAWYSQQQQKNNLQTRISSTVIFSWFLKDNFSPFLQGFSSAFTVQISVIFVGNCMGIAASWRSYNKSSLSQISVCLCVEFLWRTTTTVKSIQQFWSHGSEPTITVMFWRKVCNLIWWW